MPAEDGYLTRPSKTRLEAVPAIRMSFALIGPDAETKEEQEQLAKALVQLKTVVEETAKACLPNVKVGWDRPQPGMVLTEWDENGKPLPLPEPKEEKAIPNAGGYL